MKTILHSTVLIVVFVAIFVLGFSCAGFAQDAGAVFKAKCVMCHGADAAGKTPMGAKLNIPDLRAPEIQKKSAADLGTAIAKGKNKMPAFEGKLSAAEVAQLADYIHKLKK